MKIRQKCINLNFHKNKLDHATLSRCLDMVSSDVLRFFFTIILKKCPHTFIHDWNLIHGAIEIRLFASTANNLISIGLCIRFPNIIVSENHAVCVCGGGYGGPWTKSTEDACTKRMTWPSSFQHDLGKRNLQLTTPATSWTGNGNFINWRNQLSSANIPRGWLNSAKYWRPQN